MKKILDMACFVGPHSRTFRSARKNSIKMPSEQSPMHPYGQIQESRYYDKYADGICGT